jgi:radical SAM protein with 4Fe4S-binding SPASM domain
MYIKTTENCQLKCAHCYLGQEHPNIMFNPEKTLKWLKKFDKSVGAQLGICLHGGEPLLVETSVIEKFMDDVNKIKPNTEWSICTNLVFNLTDEKLDLLKRIKMVASSWDYDDIKRFNPKQLELWEKNFRKCSEHIDMTIITSLSKGLVENVKPEEMNDLIMSYGARGFILERIMGAHALPKELIPYNRDVDEWCRRLFIDYIEREHYKEYANIIFSSMISSVLFGGKPSTYSRNCVSEVLTIHATGKIAGCPSAQDLIYGDFNDSIEDLAKSKARIKFRLMEKTHPEACYECDVFDMCSGGCVLLEWQNEDCLGLPVTLRHIRSEIMSDKHKYIKILEQTWRDLNGH